MKILNLFKRHKLIILYCTIISLFCFGALFVFYDSAHHQDSSYNIVDKVGKQEVVINKKTTKSPKPIEEPLIEIKYEPMPKYTEDELYMMSHLIMGEAGGQSRGCKIAVGSVVLNRVKSDRFPKTNDIKSVIFAKGQYACTWDGNYNKTPNEESIEVAKFLLENGSQLPEYVIFQSRFKQGNATYAVIDGEYFCYYKEDAK